MHDSFIDTEYMLSEDFLTEDLTVLLENLNLQIKEVEKDSLEVGIPPHQMRTTQGNYILAPLLIAKSHALSAIVMMRQMKNQGDEYLKKYIYEAEKKT